MKSSLYSVFPLLIVLTIIVAIPAAICKDRSLKKITWGSANRVSLSKWYELCFEFTVESDSNNMVVLRKLGLVIESMEHKDAIQLEGVKRKYDENHITGIYRYA